MLPEAYRRLLRVPGAKALIASALVGRLPVGMASLAMVLLIRETTGSFASAGAVAAAYALGGGLFAPVQGRLVDRFGQTLILIPSALVNAGAFVLFALFADSSAPDWALLGLSGIAGASIPPLSACMRALWSDLLADGPLLDTAYAVEAVMVEVFFIGGPILTAVIAGTVSPQAALLTAAAFGLTGTLGFAATAASRAWRTRVRVVGHAGALASAGMRTLVFAVFPAGVVFGVMEVALPAFADAHGGAANGGLLLSAMAVGSLIGGVWYGARKWDDRVARRYIIISALFAIGLAPTVLAGSLVTMGILVAVAGLALAPITTCTYGLIDRVAPAGTATEAFTWVLTATIGGTALGAALAGTVVESSGVPWALGGAALSAAVAALVAFLRRRTLEASPSGAPHDVPELVTPPVRGDRPPEPTPAQPGPATEPTPAQPGPATEPTPAQPGPAPPATRHPPGPPAEPRFVIGGGTFTGRHIPDRYAASRG